jgi:hypothetical protein
MNTPTESKPSFFRPNLETKGRVIRGIGALALALAGVAALFKLVILGLVLLISAAFVLYEAVRGWCVMRACGIKTKL